MLDKRRTFTGAILMIVASTRNKAIQIRGFTLLPTSQFRTVLPSSNLKSIASATATSSCDARTAYANLPRS